MAGVLKVVVVVVVGVDVPGKAEERDGRVLERQGLHSLLPECCHLVVP